MLVCFPCVWLCLICVSFEVMLGSFVLTLSLRCYRAHGELNMVSNQHSMYTKISWTHAGTNLLGDAIVLTTLLKRPREWICPPSFWKTKQLMLLIFFPSAMPRMTTPVQRPWTKSTAQTILILVDIASRWQTANCGNCQGYSVRIEASLKWFLFCRWHIQMHFLDWKWIMNEI